MSMTWLCVCVNILTAFLVDSNVFLFAWYYPCHTISHSIGLTLPCLISQSVMRLQVTSDIFFYEDGDSHRNKGVATENVCIQQCTCKILVFFVLW